MLGGTFFLGRCLSLEAAHAFPDNLSTCYLVSRILRILSLKILSSFSRCIMGDTERASVMSGDEIDELEICNMKRD